MGKIPQRADSIILAGRIKISQVTDCYDDLQTSNGGRLKAAIIKAEARLERLNDKMLQAKKYKTDAGLFKPPQQRRWKPLRRTSGSRQLLLNEALLELEQLY